MKSKTNGTSPAANSNSFALTSDDAASMRVAVETIAQRKAQIAELALQIHVLQAQQTALLNDIVATTQGAEKRLKEAAVTHGFDSNNVRINLDLPTMTVTVQPPPAIS